MHVDVAVAAADDAEAADRGAGSRPWLRGAADRGDDDAVLTAGVAPVEPGLGGERLHLVGVEHRISADGRRPPDAGAAVGSVEQIRQGDDGSVSDRMLLQLDRDSGEGGRRKQRRKNKDERAHHQPQDFICVVVDSIWSAEVTTLEFIS